MPELLPFSVTRSRVTHPPIAQIYLRQIAELEKRADVLLALLKVCDQRRQAVLRERDYWRHEAEALRATRP